jgi:hypothetical protein
MYGGISIGLLLGGGDVVVSVVGGVVVFLCFFYSSLVLSFRHVTGCGRILRLCRGTRRAGRPACAVYLHLGRSVVVVLMFFASFTTVFVLFFIS